MYFKIFISYTHLKGLRQNSEILNIHYLLSSFLIPVCPHLLWYHFPLAAIYYAILILQHW